MDLSRKQFTIIQEQCCLSMGKDDELEVETTSNTIRQNNNKVILGTAAT